MKALASISVYFILLCIGLFLIIRPNDSSKRLQQFYIKYPLFRYAGEKQLATRPSFMRLFGFTLIMLLILLIINDLVQ